MEDALGDWKCVKNCPMVIENLDLEISFTAL